MLTLAASAMPHNQPELRAIDAYNPREELVAWVRSFGVTTIHTGHAPGELVSGQTMVVKTFGDTIDEVIVVPFATIAATLSPKAQKKEKEITNDSSRKTHQNR